MRLVAVLALAAVVTSGCGTAPAPKAAAPRQPSASATSAPAGPPVSSAPVAGQSGAPAVPTGPGQLRLEAETSGAGRPQPMVETVAATMSTDGAVQWTWTAGGSLKPDTGTYRTAGDGFEVRTATGTWSPTESVHGVGLAAQNLWGSSRPGDVLPDLVAATVDWKPTATGWTGRITEDSSVDAIVRGFQRLYQRNGQPWTDRDLQFSTKTQRDSMWPRLTGGHDLAVTWTQSGSGAVELTVSGGSVRITGSWTPAH